MKDGTVIQVAYVVRDIDAAMNADRTEGTAFGIQGTPSMIVGTQLLQGAQSYDTVSGLLDAQLGK